MSVCYQAKLTSSTCSKVGSACARSNHSLKVDVCAVLKIPATAVIILFKMTCKLPGYFLEHVYVNKI